MTLGEHTRLRRSSTVVSREIASETLVVPVRGGVGDLDSIFSFNPLGTEIWKLMASNHSLGEMATSVAYCYEVSRQKALADIQEFLLELLAAGLASITLEPGCESLVEQGHTCK